MPTYTDRELLPPYGPWLTSPDGTLGIAVTGDGLGFVCLGVQGKLFDATPPTNGQVWTYDSGTGKWVAATPAAPSGVLLAANNLSDLASAATARTNLGLGTAATTASAAYDASGAASAAQTAAEAACLKVLSVVTATTTYAMTAADDVLFVNAAGGNVVVTLPDATSPACQAKTFRIKRIDSSGNSVTVNPIAGNVEGAGSASLAAVGAGGVTGDVGSGMEICSDGTNWWIVGNY